jgi:hypothetical protein
MSLKVAYFQPTIMAIDQIPPVEFSKIYSLANELHQHPELHDYNNPFLNIRGGQQIQVFPNNINLDVKWLVAYLETVCQGYMEIVTAQSGAEDLKLCQPQIISIWTTRLSEGDYQEMHSHPAGHLSGNMYITVPELAENSNPSDGQISFRMPFTKDVSKFILNDTWKNKPQEGSIMIFPSNVPHTVYPWKGTGYRTVMSFDAILRPKDELLPPEFKNG